MNNTFKENLKEGQVFKNRKELCVALNEEYYKQTKSKKAQDKRWKRYFDFDKIEGSNKIRIKKIYDIPKLHLSTQGGGLSQYCKPLLLDFFYKEVTKPYKSNFKFSNKNDTYLFSMKDMLYGLDCFPSNILDFVFKTKNENDFMLMQTFFGKEQKFNIDEDNPNYRLLFCTIHRTIKSFNGTLKTTLKQINQILILQ